MDILQVENVSFTYPQQSVPALSEVSFSLSKGTFALLVGASGCGKTTLLRLLKTALAPNGQIDGTIRYNGADIQSADAAAIGFVAQSPDEQIVTDEVWHELAFGLENLGLPREVIRRRVGEVASYFGIQNWYHQRTDTLSGGQKQLLNLAAVMAMQPRLLLLDEPTAQLDPLAAAEFMTTLQKINRELGVTVLLVEHRLEDVYAMADRVLVLEQGRLVANDTPRAVCAQMKGHPLFAGFPSAARIWNELPAAGDCPLTVREGRDFLDREYPFVRPFSPPETQENREAAIEASGIWFRYEKDAPDVLRDLSLNVRQGEIFSVLGGNGSGKTTMLQVLSGLERPYKGRCRVFGQKMSRYKGAALYRHVLAALPQDPRTVFVKSTVKEDMAELLEAQGVPRSAWEMRIAQQAAALEIEPLLTRQPYDLSGGEMQKCALAKLLLTDPRLLLLDEPTKGMDAYSKQTFAHTLQTLRDKGMTILLVTHDVEFAAMVSDRCGLFFDGTLMAPASPHVFFSQNSFYTTAACRMAREHFAGAVLCDEVVALCREGAQ